MALFNLYKDIKARTDGEIYIGVVGPVRSGKSTFIKRFMEKMILPNFEDENEKIRAVDEMPQSAGGKTIMTAEPKFIPSDAVEVRLSEDTVAKFRLIDCVGFMVEGAAGHIEGDTERSVKTPWFDYEIPFSEAAELGTRKVIKDHSTIGIIITSDGSFGELERNAYEAAEEKAVNELKAIGKPFVIILNTVKPYSEEAHARAEEMQNKYGVRVLPVSCEQLRKEDITNILEAILFEFPVSEMKFYMPGWIDMLSRENPIKSGIIGYVKEFIKKIGRMKDFRNQLYDSTEDSFVNKVRIDKICLEVGTADIYIETDESYYYQTISNLLDADIKDEYSMIRNMKELALMKKEYLKLTNAYQEVLSRGYGVVTPTEADIVLEKPELIKHGNRFGVKVKANAPSIHMIAANIETEIAPIVGTEEQANDLINYISSGADEKENIKEALIFGKSIGDMVSDGISSKIDKMTDECRIKLQETIQKIVNESSKGIVFIII